MYDLIFDSNYPFESFYHKRQSLTEIMAVRLGGEKKKAEPKLCLVLSKIITSEGYI